MPAIPNTSSVAKAIATLEKAAAAGVLNAAGSARLQGLARTYGDTPAGTATPAIGTRPNPGALPDASAESPFNPLTFQFPWGGNLNYTPRTGFGTPFQTLRNLASVSPEIFMCIQTRKDQMASLVFDYRHRDQRAKGDEVDRKVNAARAFFAKPDKVTPFATWVQTLVDEVLVIDALSIYKRRTRGGQMYGYEIIDGATIKVLLDDRGQVPQPPNIAYRQIIYGAPMSGGDCTTDELMYLPKNVRTWSPYGMSPTEAVLLIVTSALNRTIHNLSYYVKGNIPEALVGVPDSWNTQQLNDFTQFWNLLLKGDPENRAGLRFVSETMAKSVHEFRQADFTTTWELWLLKVICACFGVTPSEVGFTDDVNKATSKTQGDVNQRRGVKPMAGFIKGILDAMLATDLGLPEIETTFSGGEGEDALSQAQITNINLRNGRWQLDDVRAQDGLPALKLPPGLIGPAGFVPFTPAAAAAPAPGTPGSEDDSTSLEEPPKADGEAAALAAELKKYQTVAVKAVRAGKPVPAFTSTILPATLHTGLIQSLAAARSEGDVGKVFTAVRAIVRGAVRKADLAKPTPAQKRETKAMAKKLTTILGDMREEFARHIAAGVEAHG